ncbi:phosphoenolpyruvate--protein phosphotransferase [Paenibacillus tyrfis]|uniref:Phosphoenolpyruvate-protein phosphotransferase n=1 Tax=Paenibacillus tyrfis TaxID=1501230 RepID=A0A081P2R3_9BACL|nr:phosphoenolpyruvate--protein phosphotransferase [Paenibacillus tyrfis]KEQ24986.1 phosphoenolpyruvate-protein phosphotransferase [Paenibacillus tyrfis]
MMQGLSASSGIAIGRALIIYKEERSLTKAFIDESQVPDELQAFDAAVQRAKEQLKLLMTKLEEAGNEQEAGIIEGQWFLLDDPALMQEVSGKIRNEKVQAAWAAHQTFREYMQAFELMEDEYIKERIADMKDAESRLLDEILGVRTIDLSALSEPAVILAHDLTPSMTAQMNKKTVLGFVTEVGSKTSHTAIMARTFGIPAVVGVSGLLDCFSEGDWVVLDGEAGQIIRNPMPDQLEAYERKRKEYAEFTANLAAIRDMPSLTIDGKRFELYGNIGKPEEAEMVLQQSGEGIGLFRTEFLFMDRGEMPSEEEQYEAYKEVLLKMQGKPVIIRTLDIGGDKEIPYLPLGKEFNPFLGWRAIRYCLADPALFKTQLRALLRAAVHGDLRIMFPMISGEKEILDAKTLLAEAEQELSAQGMAFKSSVPLGIMIEIPAAALVSDKLAQHVDFFSIGTNDLIQYTVAADRMNEKVSYLYDSQHLAVLRLIDIVCRNAKKYGKHVGMCGEMAGDPRMAKLLIGLGVEEWSMSASQIPLVKQAIMSLSESDCVNDVRELLN